MSFLGQNSKELLYDMQDLFPGNEIFKDLSSKLNPSTNLYKKLMEEKSILC